MRYVGHVCDSVNASVNNALISQIRELEDTYYRGNRLTGLPSRGSRFSSASEGIDEDADGSMKHFYFHRAVQAYVDENCNGWGDNGDMGYLYKQYFCGSHIRFCLIQFTGDLIIIKRTLEKKFTHKFADRWFENVLMLLNDCVNIE
jgi:hypothetical protein